MANFNFEPPEGLNNTSTFVDEPTTGAAARQQFMTLFNQLKDYVNVLNNQSYPANGGNADTLDGQHSNAFAGSNHDHNSTYAQVNHMHYWGHIIDLPNNLTKSDIPLWTWTGTIPYNSQMFVNHPFGRTNLLFTYETTVGNVNPTVKVEDSTRFSIGNYNDTGGNSCVVTIKVW